MMNLIPEDFTFAYYRATLAVLRISGKNTNKDKTARVTYFYWLAVSADGSNERADASYLEQKAEEIFKELLSSEYEV